MAELGEKHWYIVNTYSQHEKKVAENLRRRIETLQLQDYIFNILVAEHEVPVIDKETGLPKPGETKMKNLYPGYIFVEMIMTDKIWYYVRNTPGVTGITGSAGGGQKPTPVSREEMESLSLTRSLKSTDNDVYDYNEMLVLAASLDDCEEIEPGDIIWAKLTGICLDYLFL